MNNNNNNNNDSNNNDSNNRNSNNNDNNNNDNNNIIDLNHLAENQPSMCIPRVFDNVDEKQIRDVFQKLDLGKIDHIDVIERRTEKGDKYKRVFIHFTKWNLNEDACAARQRLVEGKDIKVVYNNPWFWKISANRWPTNNVIKEEVEIQKPVRKRRGGPRIEIDKDNKDNIQII